MSESRSVSEADESGFHKVNSMTKIVKTSYRVRKNGYEVVFNFTSSVSELSVLEFHIKTDNGIEVFADC